LRDKERSLSRKQDSVQESLALSFEKHAREKYVKRMEKK
jgi:hypothetical protein